jgi:hypothetical protein
LGVALYSRIAIRVILCLFGQLAERLKLFTLLACALVPCRHILHSAFSSLSNLSLLEMHLGLLVAIYSLTLCLQTLLVSYDPQKYITIFPGYAKDSV